jgi:hypothetical protein
MSEMKPFEVQTSEQMLLGKLAVQFDLMSNATLDRLLAEQSSARSSGGDGQPLGELLVAGGHIEAFQLDHLLDLQRFLRNRHQDREFARLVLETGYITDDEVDYAFKAQEAAFEKDRSVRLVGDLLVEFGSIDDDLRNELLVKQGRS